MIRFLSDRVHTFFAKQQQKQILKNAGIASFPFKHSDESFFYLRDLSNKGAVFSVVDDHFEVKLNGSQFTIKSGEELLIAHEVFVKKIYPLPLKDDFVFIDIGFNVGLASIYAAQHKNCKQIIAFEPFQKTINTASENISAVRKLITSFDLHAYGLGFPERKLNVHYSYLFKGSSGINGINPVIQPPDVSLEKLSIKDAAIALRNVLENSKNVVIKMDCEGAEYEIIRRLENENLLTLASAYLIEWHHEGVAPLEKVFSKYRYIVSKTSEVQGNGIFYAFKSQE